MALRSDNDASGEKATVDEATDDQGVQVQPINSRSGGGGTNGDENQAQTKAETKVDLTKVAQSLREDATEGM